MEMNADRFEFNKEMKNNKTFGKVINRNKKLIIIIY